MIELIYDPDCPNVEDTRNAVRAALRRTPGLETDWKEWDRTDPASPDYACRYGSPTVLVGGRDVAGAEPVDAPSCRIYSDHLGRTRGVPPADLIVAALERLAAR